MGDGGGGLGGGLAGGGEGGGGTFSTGRPAASAFALTSLRKTCSSSLWSVFVSSSCFRSFPSFCSRSRCSGVIFAMYSRTDASVISTSPISRCNAFMKPASASAASGFDFASSTFGASACFLPPLLPLPILR